MAISSKTQPTSFELRFRAKLKRFLEEVGYRDGIGALEWRSEGAGIVGRFGDRLGNKTFEFSIDASGVAYRPAQWRDDSTDRSDARAARKRQCTSPTAYACGQTCITRSKRCRIKSAEVRQAASGLVAEARQIDREAQPPTGARARVAQSVAISPKARAALAREEDRIRDLDYESCAAIDPVTGEVLLRKDGDKTSISFTDEEAERMQGTVFTHNHPNLGFRDDDPRSSGFSLSDADIRTAHNLEMIEMRAVTRDYTHSIKPPPGGWNERTWEQKTQAAYRRNEAEVYRSMMQDIRSGKLDPYVATRDYHHRINELTAKETGMTYRRTPYSRDRRDSVQTSRNKGKGIRCGQGYISPDKECRSGAKAASPMQGTLKPDRGKAKSAAREDQRRVRQVAGLALAGSVIGLLTIQTLSQQSQRERMVQAVEGDTTQKRKAKEYEQQIENELKQLKRYKDYEMSQPAKEVIEKAENAANSFLYGKRMNQTRKGNNWWTVLGVKQNASRAEVKKAFDKLVADLSPEARKNPAVRDRIQEVGEAFGIASEQKRDSVHLDATAPAVRRQMMQVLKRSIEESFGAIDAVLAFQVDPIGFFTGKFRDGAEVYDFEISPSNALSYVEADAEGLRSDAYLAGYTLASGMAKGVRRDAPRSTAKPKQCLQGKPCKGGCIARGFRCRTGVSPATGRSLDAARQALGVKSQAADPQAVARQYRVSSPVAIGAIAGAAVLGLPIAGYMAFRAKYRSGFKESAKRAQKLMQNEDYLSWIPDGALAGAKQDVQADQVTLVVGGFAGDEGQSGVSWAKEFRGKDGAFNNHHIVAIDSKEFDVPIAKNREEQAKLERELPLRTALEKGYNPVAVRTAALAYAYKQKHPNLPVNLIGYSAGGMATHEAAEILKEMGVKDVRTANFGSPYWGLTERAGKSVTFASPNDPVIQAMPIRDRVDVNSVTDHFTYFRNKDVRSRLADFFADRRVETDRASDNTDELRAKAERRRKAEERLRQRKNRRQDSIAAFV